MVLSEIHWTAQVAYPILGVLQVIPLCAMGLMLLMRGRPGALSLGIVAALTELLVALDLYRLHDHGTGAMQFAERINLPGPFGYHAAADGLTVLFVLLNAVLTLLVVVYSNVRGMQPLYRVLSLVFAVEAALMMFSASFVYFV